MKDVRLNPTLTIVLKFLRADAVSDPYAFRGGKQSYKVDAEGGTFPVFHIDWNDELFGLLDAVQRVPAPQQAATTLGQMLSQILQPAEWNLHERAIEQALNTGAGVHIVVCSSAAELYALPWELVTDRRSGLALGATPGVLLSYSWPGVRSAARQTPPARPSVLLACASNGDSLPIDAHVDAYCAPGRPAWLDPARDLIADCSLDELAVALNQRRDLGAPVSHLHLLCHGGQREGVVGLWLKDRDLVTPSRLQAVLHEHRGSLQTVVLSACKSGSGGSPSGRIGSVAQAVHRNGVPLVIGSRFPLAKAASALLTQHIGSSDGSRQGLVDAFLAARGSVGRKLDGLDAVGFQLWSAVRPEELLVQVHKLEEGPQAAAQAPTVPLAVPTQDAAPPTPMEPAGPGTGSWIALGIVSLFWPLFANSLGQRLTNDSAFALGGLLALLTLTLMGLLWPQGPGVGRFGRFVLAAWLAGVCALPHGTDSLSVVFISVYSHTLVLTWVLSNVLFWVRPSWLARVLALVAVYGVTYLWLVLAGLFISQT